MRLPGRETWRRVVPGFEPCWKIVPLVALRTLTGARQFCAIRSYLSTAAKHNLNFFDALVMLTNGEPWMPRPGRSIRPLKRPGAIAAPPGA
jgi:hypothetical protein